MPCSDGRCHITEANDLRRELNDLTRLLCMACDYIDDEIIGSELKAWKEKHDEVDRIRLEREARDTAARKERRKESLKFEIAAAEAKIQAFKQELADS